MLDLLYVALFAVVLPLWDYFIYWPALRRQSLADPARARRRLWSGAISSAWALVAVGAALWLANDRSWTSFGFSVPQGWRLWTCAALILLLAVYQIYAIATVARSSDARASVRQQSGELTAFTPRSRGDMYWFSGLSLTAGFCEEFLYRGYFIWVFAPWLGWWGAAALSLAFFAVAHVGVYAGWSGAIRTGIVGAFFTLVVAIFDSLWPAIVLHSLIDLGAGIMGWLASLEEQSTGEASEVHEPTEMQSAPGVDSSPDSV